MKKFRANFLTLPYGVAYLPIPRPETYSLVVGNPIEVPFIPDPTPEIIEAFHHHYFTQIARLFDKYKSECDHADSHLIVKLSIL